MIPLTETPHGVSFAVRVTPRAGRTSIAGTRGGALLVRLAAAPVDGAANDALVELLAGTFQCPRHAVTIVHGAKNREKVVRVSGLPRERIESTLLAILTP